MPIITLYSANRITSMAARALGFLPSMQHKTNGG